MPPPVRPSRLRKYSRRLVVLGVVLGGLYAAYYYFGSRQLAPLVASRLQAALGGRVDIEEVVPGLESSSLKGVRFFEKDAVDSKTPILEMREIEADVSSLDAVKGIALPKNATVKGGQLLLRFDANNKLLTQLPVFEGKHPAPKIQMEDCKVILRQEGRNDFEVSGVRGEIEPDGSDFRLKGTIDDPFWGKWTWNATFEQSSRTSVLILSSPTRHVTQAILDKVPFVPASVWKQVQFPEGDTPVDLTLILRPAKKQVNYRVVLAPKATKLRITSIDLDAEQAEGKVEIADKVVTLTDVRGRAADGTIKTHGELDFKIAPSRLKFHVEAEQLELTKLPKTWNRPDNIHGRLSGKADIDLRIVDGKAQCGGNGRGIVTTMVASKSISIPLRMFSDGKKFHFAPDLLPGLLKGAREQSFPESFAQNLLLHILPALQQPQPQKMLNSKLQLKDADLEQLLKSLGIKLGTPLTGKVTTDLEVQVPWNKVADRSAYRFKGTISASRLETPELRFEQVQARLEYADNVLKLDNLEARLSVGGDVRGKVEVRFLPMDKTDVTLDLNLVGVSLKLVQKLVPELYVSLDGRFSGTLRGNLLTAAGQPIQFVGKLEGTAAPVWIEGIRTEKWQGTIDLQPTVYVYQLQGDVLGGKADVHVFAPLGAGEVPESSIRLSRLYLGRLSRAILGEPRIPLHGTLSADVTFRPTGPKREFTGGGKLVIERFRVDATESGETLRADLQVAQNQLRVRDVTGRYAQGRLRGQIVLGLTRSTRSWFNLTLEQAEAQRLLSSWPELADHVQGPVQVMLRGRVGRESSGTGEISFSRLRAFNVEMLDGRVPLHWTYTPSSGQGLVQFQESRAQVASGRLTGQGSVTLGATTRVETKVRFQGVQLRPLVRSFTDSTQVSQGTMTGRLEINGDNVHSADDLTGTLDAVLQQAQILELPVFRQVSALVLPRQATGTLFPTGVVKARLTHSLVRIEKFGFNGSAGQVFIAGTVSLHGQLNLDVTANTGRTGLNPGTLLVLGSLVPRSGPIPLPVLNQATALLANRVLVFHVTGTTSHPAVRIQPLAILTQEALRFLVFSTVLPAI